MPQRIPPELFQREERIRSVPMKLFRKALLFFPTLVLLACSLFLNAAWAITAKEEEELAREFMKAARARYEFIEDPCIVGMVNNIGKRIVGVLRHRSGHSPWYGWRREVS